MGRRIKYGSLEMLEMQDIREKGSNFELLVIKMKEYDPKGEKALKIALKYAKKGDN